MGALRGFEQRLEAAVSGLGFAYLAGRLVECQRQLVQRLESSADQLAADPQAQALVQKIAASQREGLVQLLAAVPGK